jgi:hypothetical protein
MASAATKRVQRGIVDVRGEDTLAEIVGAESPLSVEEDNA